MRLLSLSFSYVFFFSSEEHTRQISLVARLFREVSHAWHSGQVILRKYSGITNNTPRRNGSGVIDSQNVSFWRRLGFFGFKYVDLLNPILCHTAYVFYTFVTSSTRVANQRDTIQVVQKCSNWQKRKKMVSMDLKTPLVLFYLVQVSNLKVNFSSVSKYRRLTMSVITVTMLDQPKGLQVDSALSET